MISFNRGPMMLEVIESYRRQTVPVEIVVHDNGSDDLETLRVLDRLEREGVRVFRRDPIESADDLSLVDLTVSAVFADREAGPYVVTDCDISLERSAPDSIATYLRLLDLLPEASCVGPMLRIEDIRQSYPLFARVMNLHIRQFWHSEPARVRVHDREVAYITAGIDTTFAVHRAGEPFRRLKTGARVYHPFDAEHLDWHPDRLSVRARAYRERSSAEISHWDNAVYATEHAAERLEVDEYVVVADRDATSLVTRRRGVHENPA
jgi:hypothetical protein